MKRPIKHSVLFSLAASIMYLLSTAGEAAAITALDADTMAGAFRSAFYVQNGDAGYFKDTETSGVSYFWTQAEMIETVIDAYEWSGDESLLTMSINLLNGFLQKEGTSWSWNMYNDDIMWATLAFARVAQHTGNSYYANIAKSNFDMCYARGWDDVLGGGMYWTTDNGSKNACANGNTAIAAYLLYQIFGDSAYLDKANAVYEWERSVLFNSDSGAIYDNIGTDGSISYWSSTYNQGTFIGAAHFLGHPEDAKLAANYTMLRLTSNGILPQYGIAGNNSGFNATLLRWLNRFVNDRNLQDLYGPWLQQNAAAAWNLRRADNLSWCQWQEQTPADTTFYSWDCISSFSAVFAAEQTQTNSPYPVPHNSIGYWPLDSNATDCSGNENDGTANNAVWSSSGRIDGCLTLNGSNTSVELANPLCNDFSIVFWAKTTQSSSGTQWWQGNGLVDADEPYAQDDFGTSLLNGKFAFGIGNSDLTIQSTTSINDGSWHQCVATRKQATGTICVYVDGELEASDSGNANSLDTPATLRFGLTGSHYFNGSLDDIQLFTRTLSSAEVAGLYYSETRSPLTAPSNVQAVAGNAEVTLDWTDAAGATSYNIKRALVTGGPYTTIANTSETSYTDTGLDNNRTYYYVVSGANSIGEGADSGETDASPIAMATWFKTDSITNLSDGADVSLWTDSSGNGNHAIQPLTARRPTFSANAINGKPAIHFDASDESYLWLRRPVQDDFTIMMVYQSTQGVGTGTDFYQGAGLLGGEVGGVVNDFGLSLNANGRVLAGTGNPDTTISSAAGFNDGQPHVVTFQRDQSLGTIRLYVDGVGVSDTGGTQSLTAPSALMLGAQQVLNNYLTGDIAEVRIYNSLLSATPRIYEERALKARYGISGGSAPRVPTDLAALADNHKAMLNWTMAAGAETYSIWRSTDGGTTYELIASGLTNSSYVDTFAVSEQDILYRVAGVNDYGTGTQTVALSVNVPMPELAFLATIDSVDMCWTNWADDWTLYGATNLSEPLTWQPLTTGIESNEAGFSISLPTDSPYHFFQLSYP